MPAPADIITGDLPSPLSVPVPERAAAAERVVSELLAAWWFPAEPTTFAELADETTHLTTDEWSQQWADASENSPQLTDQTSALQVVDLVTTSASETDAQVSVIADQDGRTRSYVFDLINDGAGWRVAGLR